MSGGIYVISLLVDDTISSPSNTNSSGGMSSLLSLLSSVGRLV